MISRYMDSAKTNLFILKYSVSQRQPGSDLCEQEKRKECHYVYYTTTTVGHNRKCYAIDEKLLSYPKEAR